MAGAIEISMLVIALTGIVGGIWNRIQLKKGIGIRFIQYLGLTLLLPLIIVLSLENRISQEMTGAIFATAVGAVLASLGRDGAD